MTRGRWIAAVVAVAVVGGGLVAVQMSGLFGTGDRARACERALTEAAGQVPGVLSAEAECNLQFGGGWQRQTVRLDAGTPEEAYPIVEQILRALAGEPAVESGWSTPQIYELTTGDTLQSLEQLGFNGPPSVGEVRARYGIEPVR